MAASSSNTERVLGLDIGFASVGWCLIETVDGTASRILGMGSRIFSPGVEGNAEDFSRGRDKPKAADRRGARLMRRQLWRRRRRLLKLHRALIRCGLLPALPAYDAESIDRGFKDLDRVLMARDPAMSDHRAAQVFHYRLRARAADGAVAPHELGRALYHLAQHRGFLSNRKSKVRDGEEDGAVKSGIADLKAAMDASGARTLGAYFASIDPEQQRIRTRWLGRNEMIVPEFEAIVAQQSKHLPAISADDWEEIRKAIFTQRPLRDQSHLIGNCALEEGQRRCPAAYPEAQEFRILQSVNHLRLVELDGGVEKSERALTAEERSTLLEELMVESELSMTQAKKALGLKPKSWKFSIERGGEKRIIGNRTHANIVVTAGAEAHWQSLDDATRQRVIDDMLEYEAQDALAKRLHNKWGFSRDAARGLAEIHLESSRLNFSRLAIAKMLPFLRQGLSVQEAKIAAYPSLAGADAPWDLLPPLRPNGVWREHCSKGRPYNGVEVRNPAVERSLSELRKVVNAVIRRWGKPDVLRIELARDLKKPRAERKKASSRMREQEKWREAAVDKMIQEGFGVRTVQKSRSDIEKVLLWEECSGVCPYTGRPIAFEDLFGASPRFEVEHIIPYSLCLEDGFANKTLCEISENRNRKGRQSPFDAYAGTPEWEQILARVRQFRGAAASKKLRLFQSEQNGQEIFGDFTQRQLNDTRYASRLASDYVGMLFGGKVDANSRQRVFVSAGGATAVMRRTLGLEKLLGGGQKNRKDHRHHAVDALAIALTGPREVKAIAQAASDAQARNKPAHRLEMQAPWSTFLEDAQRVVDGIIVSHRVDRRLSGPMHEATNYSRPMRDPSGTVRDESVRHKRYALESLKTGDIDDIVDAGVRAAVRAKLAELGQRDPKIAFKGGTNLPSLPRKDGRVVVVRKVRVKVRKSLATVGNGPSRRHVAPGSNHHMAVIETRGVSGVRLDAEVVTMLEAYQRKSCGEPVVRTDFGPGRRLLYTLRSGDAVELEIDGQRTPCVVSGVSDAQISLKTHTDARSAMDIRKVGVAGGRLALSIVAFHRAMRGKRSIGPIGSVVIAND
jgi:CRISPR-associated endonuclease Csn1